MPNGINPDDLRFESLPGVVGTHSGRVLICGSGRCLWDDLKAAIELGAADIMAVKQAGIYIPMPIRHWVGCHGERFQWQIPLRRGGYYFRGRPSEGSLRPVHTQKHGYTVHADKAWPLVDHAWPGPLTGTSALFGARVAMGLGYDEAILCGVPLDDSGRFYDAPWDKGVDLNVAEMSEWEAFVPIFNGRVRSMSGRTRDLLGGP